MTLADEHATADPDHGRLMQALSYRAPFLIEKLLKERIVDTAEQGEALFAEVLKYLILNRMYPAKKWDMMSRLVDEVWHQFVLFTTEYLDFSKSYFGHYLHHAPGNSPSAPQRSPRDAPSTLDFAEHYRAVFGGPLPAVWYDRRSVTLHRRVLVNHALGKVNLVPEDDSEFVTLVGAKGPVVSIHKLAITALEFITRTPAFYVRELPGELTDEEKIGLIETLLAARALLLAS